MEDYFGFYIDNTYVRDETPMHSTYMWQSKGGGRGGGFSFYNFGDNCVALRGNGSGEYLHLDLDGFHSYDHFSGGWGPNLRWK